MNHPWRLVDITCIGKGGNDRYVYGLHLLLTVSSSGVATGWSLAAGNIQNRWLTELFLSSRAGVPQLSGPENTQGALRLERPTNWIRPTQSCGTNRRCPIVADLGYSGEDWHLHWTQDYQVTLITPPKCTWHGAVTWFSSLRQAIETAFSSLCESFGLHFPKAHTTWGLLTRISAKVAAYDLGILINRQCGRPDWAFQMLVW